MTLHESNGVWNDRQLGYMLNNLFQTNSKRQINAILYPIISKFENYGLNLNYSRL